MSSNEHISNDLEVWLVWVSTQTFECSFSLYLNNGEPPDSARKGWLETAQEQVLLRCVEYFPFVLPFANQATNTIRVLYLTEISTLLFPDLTETGKCRDTLQWENCCLKGSQTDSFFKTCGERFYLNATKFFES